MKHCQLIMNTVLLIIKPAVMRYPDYINIKISVTAI